MSVSFTQYLRPNARTQEITINLAPEIEATAHALQERGCRFTAEVLSTGVCCFCCEFEGEDIAMQLSKNDETVIASVEQLIHDAQEHDDTIRES